MYLLRVILHFVAGLLGLAVGMVGLIIPIFAYFSIATESGWGRTHEFNFWGLVGAGLLVVIGMAVCFGIAYALLKYAAAEDTTEPRTRSSVR